MSSPRAPRAQGSGLRDRRARRGRPSPRGRRCCPRCPGERPCPAGLCGKGCPEPREGRHSRTRPSRWPRAPGILTFYTDTATSEKVFAGAGGTWLSPDADDPAGAGLCLVWPRWCRVVAFMGLVKARVRLHRNLLLFLLLLLRQVSPRVPKLLLFHPTHVLHPLFPRWGRAVVAVAQRGGGHRVGPWQGLLCPRGFSQTKTRQAQGTESQARQCL